MYTSTANLIWAPHNATEGAPMFESYSEYPGSQAEGLTLRGRNDLSFPERREPEEVASLFKRYFVDLFASNPRRVLDDGFWDVDWASFSHGVNFFASFWPPDNFPASSRIEPESAGIRILLRGEFCPEISTEDLEREGLVYRVTTALTSVSPLPAWQARVQTADTPEQIVAIFRLFGLRGIADRVLDLIAIENQDPEEPTMDVTSLRNMALFLMGERHIPNPQIAVCPSGLVLCEWELPHNGILAIEFLSSDLIRFAAISGSTEDGGVRKRVNGTLPKKDAMAALQSFLPDGRT